MQVAIIIHHHGYGQSPRFSSPLPCVFCVVFLTLHLSVLVCDWAWRSSLYLTCSTQQLLLIVSASPPVPHQLISSAALKPWWVRGVGGFNETDFRLTQC